MRRPEKDPIAISERELQAMTADLEQMHHESMRDMRTAVAEWGEELRTSTGAIGGRTSRRRFLLGAGAALAGGVLLAACSDDKDSNDVSSGGTDTTAASGKDDLQGDLKVAALAAALENLAVGTYQAGLDAATAGRLGEVPPAVANFAETAQTQHRDHAQAFNATLTQAGKQAVNGVDLTLKRDVDDMFAQVNDVSGLARLALGVEDVAAATYLKGVTEALKDKSAIKTAASIQPVEMQHAAILRFVLGEYPVPDDFAKTEGARPTTDEIG